MIPIRDNIPSRHTPVVNYLVIGLCGIAFFFQLASGENGNTVVEEYGMIPARLSHPEKTIEYSQQVPVQTSRGIQVQTIKRVLEPSPIPAWMTLFTCMFLHGGWMHFLGNMWFLYIFGDNVEDRLGHLGFTLLYLGTGVAAALAHFLTDRLSPIPTIGASGAIAGVMGAYAWLYPHAKVQAFIPLVVIMQMVILPAPIFLGGWFLLQTYSGIASSSGGGVAWWAHIGGFVAGAAAAVLIGRSPLGHEAVSQRRF